MSGTAPAISLNDVRKSFGPTEIIRGVSLDIKKGERHALIDADEHQPTDSGDERETIWSKQKKDYPGFADYEAKTSREIPVVILDPV